MTILSIKWKCIIQVDIYEHATFSRPHTHDFAVTAVTKVYLKTALSHCYQYSSADTWEQFNNY